MTRYEEIREKYMDRYVARETSTHSSSFDYFKACYSDYSSELEELKELLSSGSSDELLCDVCGYESIFERIAFVEKQLNLFGKVLAELASAEEAETEADSAPEENLPETEEDVIQLIITADIYVKGSGLDSDEILMQFTRNLLVIGASEQEIGLTLREVRSKQSYCSDKSIPGKEENVNERKEVCIKKYPDDRKCLLYRKCM